FLHRAFARSASPPAAIHEGVHRAVDLVAVAAGGIEEAVDAARHMWQREIGADQTGDARGDAGRNPDEAQAGEEELREPHRRYHRGHAEIGLLDEKPDDENEKRDGDQMPGEAI